MLRWLTGAMGRVPVDATAFPHRDVDLLVISAAFLPSDAPAPAAESVAVHRAGLAQNVFAQNQNVVLV